jgi:hypothetical protein
MDCQGYDKSAEELRTPLHEGLLEGNQMGDYIVGVFDRDELNCKVVSTMMNSVEAAVCELAEGLFPKITFGLCFGLLPLFLGVNREQGVVIEAAFGR